MWMRLFLLIFVGAIAAEHEHAWRIGQEYNYLVRSRTFTGLNELSNQYTGILIKAQLTVQPKDAQTLRAKVWRSQFANVHKELPDDWESKIDSRALELRDLPMSGKPFEIRMKHGLIRELIVEKDVPTWEVNILKSIVSQLQVDTQGESEIRSRGNQMPEEDSPYAMFKAMEDSVGGKCEVIYDIMPLPEDVVQHQPELVPMPKLKGDGHHIDIIKTKNYTRCEQRVGYHFGISEKMRWEPGTNGNGKFLTKSTTSRIVISGNLRRFVIQSSVTTNRVFVSPRLYNEKDGIVASKMNLTLINVEKITESIKSPSNPESVGNLVYTYNNPFSESVLRRPGKANVSPSSVEEKDSGSRSAASSSEEKVHHKKRTSGSDSASSSSISSSEERDFWQPKPTLENAPENPLLPYFVGNRGKSVGMSDRIDPVEAAKNLLTDISNELEDPSKMPEEDTLEKYMILTELIRTMSKKQISEVEANMHLSENDLKWNDKSQSKRQNAWATFRDAVIQAGTGPALLTIKDWIESMKIKGLEAADALSRLPKTARTPTAEFVDQLFKLIKNPVVMKDDIVSGTAVLAFAELVRQSQLSNASLHNRYPVHTFGRLAPKHNQAVLEEYLPFYEEQLRKAMKDGDSHKAQIFIIGLGHLAHPRMFSIFEPFLEGKEPSSVFQRTLMVGAMFKLAELQPRLTRSILYKIYLNTMEAHDVRCMAVFLLMKTNPPLNMLQRMADFTKYDTNKHVNSAVKTMIENLDDTTLPEYRDLAEKARAVKGLLSKEEYSYQYSQSYIHSGLLRNDNLAYRLMINYIGSDDSFLARSWYIGLDTKYGDYEAPTAAFSFMVSSMKSLLRMATDEKREESDIKPGEKIAQVLGIKSEEAVPIEGHILWNNKYTTKIFTFDEDKIRKVQGWLKKLEGSRYINMNKFTNYEVTLSFPMETGLPFVYTLKIPTLMRMAGNNKFDGKDFHNAKSKTELRLVYSKKLQGRMGFVVPFERQHHIAGVDMNFQAYLPIKFDLDVDLPKKNIEVRLWTVKSEQNTKLLHYSIVPYTSRHSILSLRPVATDKNTQKVHIRKPRKISFSNIFPILAIQNLTYEMEVDESATDMIPDVESMAFHEMVIFPWSQHSDKYKKVDISVKAETELKQPLTFTVAYDSIETGAEGTGEEPEKLQAIEPVDRKSNSAERRKQFLKETSKGVKSGKAHVVDLKMEELGEYRALYTASWCENSIGEKSRMALFTHYEYPKYDFSYEVCAAGKGTSNINELLDFSKASQTKPKSEVEVDVKYGETCSGGKNMRITYKESQSEDMKEAVEESAAAKKCKEQMQRGDKILEECRKVASSATIANEIDVSIEGASKPFHTFVDAIMTILDDLVEEEVDFDPYHPKNADTDRIDIKLKISPDLKTDITTHTTTMDASIRKMELAPLDVEMSLDSMDSWSEEDVQSVCALDKTQAETFDQRRYPLKLGKCWHVAMTTVPIRNKGKSDELGRIPEDMRVTVLVRDVEDAREVKVILGDREIHMTSSGSDRKVTDNGQKVHFSKDSSYQRKENDEVLYEIFELPDGSIRLLSEKFEIGVVYDGKRVRIQADDDYQTSIRGLCGNFDSNSKNDFITPRNCMLKDSEEFQATYALLNEDCEGPAVENARKAEKSVCTSHTHRLSNVVSEIEAGRVRENRNWGHHKNSRGDKRSGQCVNYRTKVLSKDDKICFSTRPVLSCASECKSTEQKRKSYDFYCMEKTESAMELKKRVEKGANPDLSQKPVSLVESLDVPIQCSA